MHPSISKLLSIASDSINCIIDDVLLFSYLREWGPLGKELAELLIQRNGFYAFESSLLVRPFQHDYSPLGLLQWNDDDLWKGQYAEDLSDVLFFAEDVFGGQFCIQGEKIFSFDPETGQMDAMSSSIDDWANNLVADYEFRTGYPLAHAWQIENSPLPPGMRLLPKTPFVCGGEYHIGNLYPLNDVEGMRFRAIIANQIRDLPDGAQIIIDTDTKRGT